MKDSDPNGDNVSNSSSYINFYSGGKKNKKGPMYDSHSNEAD